MGDAIVTAVLAAGWLAQAAAWLVALRSAGRRAAARREWPREVLIRAGMLALVVWALAAPRHPLPAVALAALALLVFAAAHAEAIVARRQLGEGWGIGVDPRPGTEPVRRGLYSFLAHPIYYGMSFAALAQYILLRNLPSLLLLGGTAAVAGVKGWQEGRRLRRNGG
jgi:protein-S-isoprenylcysteine O-methyltransferase Ste14